MFVCGGKKACPDFIGQYLIFFPAFKSLNILGLLNSYQIFVWDQVEPDVCLSDLDNQGKWVLGAVWNLGNGEKMG